MVLRRLAPLRYEKYVILGGGTRTFPHHLKWCQNGTSKTVSEVAKKPTNLKNDITGLHELFTKVNILILIKIV